MKFFYRENNFIAILSSYVCREFKTGLNPVYILKIKLKGKKIWAKLIVFFSFDTVKSANSEMAKKVFFICFILHCYIFSECCKHFLSEYVIGLTLNCFYSWETYTTFWPYPGCPKIDQTALT